MSLTAPRTRTRDAGFTLVEILLSVVLLGVMALGTVTLLVAQGRQLAQDKILLDMQAYANVVLNETAAAAAPCIDVQFGHLAGTTFQEPLSFQRSYSHQGGYLLESRVVQNRQRNVEFHRANRLQTWSVEFPPSDVDPRRGNGDRWRVRVTDFQVHPMEYQPTLFPLILTSNIVVIEVELEMWDQETGLRLARRFSRNVSTPNRMLMSRKWPYEPLFSWGPGYESYWDLFPHPAVSTQGGGRESL
jgi:prepilin-type N-terminal cleavage/methylation domain-containing protein